MNRASQVRYLPQYTPGKKWTSVSGDTEGQNIRDVVHLTERITLREAWAFSIT